MEMMSSNPADNWSVSCRQNEFSKYHYDALKGLRQWVNITFLMLGRDWFEIAGTQRFCSFGPYNEPH